MTDESQDAAFTSFWHRSVDKISSGKVKFMPNVTKPKNSKDEEDEATTATAQKQHRRNQVRRAQIEYRKRKQNYVKHLEEDAIRLREMISATENESSALMKENMAMKSTLSASGVTIVRPLSQKLPKPTIFLPPAEYDSFNSLRIPDSIQRKRLTIRSIDNETDNDRLSSYISEMLTQDKTSTDYFPNARDISNSSSTSGSHVGIHFDKYIDAPCLHISVPSRNSVRGPRVIDLSKPLPPLPGQASVPQNTSRTPSPDLSLIAINLILALEHPCRTHFHHPPLNPTDTPSGHELMASTTIFAQAPPSAFQDPPPSSESSWYSSSTSSSLAQLYAMSRSLPLSDVEITPVQAWFMIAEKYDSEIERVVEGRRIEGLKKGLGGLSRCYQFGAVMDVDSFWEVVDEVMGWD